MKSKPWFSHFSTWVCFNMCVHTSRRSSAPSWRPWLRYPAGKCRRLFGSGKTASCLWTPGARHRLQTDSSWVKRSSLPATITHGDKKTHANLGFSAEKHGFSEISWVFPRNAAGCSGWCWSVTDEEWFTKHITERIKACPVQLMFRQVVFVLVQYIALCKHFQTTLFSVCFPSKK